MSTVHNWEVIQPILETRRIGESRYDKIRWNKILTLDPPLPNRLGTVRYIFFIRLLGSGWIFQNYYYYVPRFSGELSRYKIRGTLGTPIYTIMISMSLDLIVYLHSLTLRLIKWKGLLPFYMKLNVYEHMGPGQHFVTNPYVTWFWHIVASCYVVWNCLLSGSVIGHLYYLHTYLVLVLDQMAGC